MNGFCVKFIPFLFVFLILIGCTTTSSINKTGGQESIYANPEKLSFTKEHRAYMLRQTYLNLAYTFPPQEDTDAILNAEDEEASQEAYENAIDVMMDSTLLRERFLDYFLKMFDVGDKYTGAEVERYPANLGAFVFLSNNPISELLLADYAINDEGANVPQTYAGGPPQDHQAGYITMEAFAQKYMNTPFMFKMVREVLGLNLRMKAPFPNANLFRWSIDQLNPRYTVLEGNDVVCHACHSGLNPIRFAFKNYQGAYNTYDVSTTQSNNQYGQEDPSGGSDVLEPRSGGVAIAPPQALDLHILIEGGTPVRTPRDLALAVIDHPDFASTWTQRILTILLNIFEGTPGQNLELPDHFSGTTGKEKFIEKWTEKFEEFDQRPKTFMRYFLKSPTYLVTGAKPEDFE